VHRALVRGSAIIGSTASRGVRPESRQRPAALRGGGGSEAHHQPSSRGKTFVYLTLVRGSAIIGSTASRQV
jgi:hypothetical protein